MESAGVVVREADPSILGLAVVSQPSRMQDMAMHALKGWTPGDTPTMATSSPLFSQSVR